MTYEMKRTILVLPTPKELAVSFGEMSSYAQAEFFNELAKHIDTWDEAFSLQVQAIYDESGLSAAARQVMQSIGEYAQNEEPADDTTIKGILQILEDLYGLNPPGYKVQVSDDLLADYAQLVVARLYDSGVLQ